MSSADELASTAKAWEAAEIALRDDLGLDEDDAVSALQMLAERGFRPFGEAHAVDVDHACAITSTVFGWVVSCPQCGQVCGVEGSNRENDAIDIATWHELVNKGAP